MTEYNIVSFDPGLITGIAGGVFSDTEPVSILAVEAVTYEDFRDSFDEMRSLHIDHVVSELFTNRTNNTDFAADVIGVRIEGMIDAAYGGRVTWRDRTKKSQVSDDLLREHGLWMTGEDANWEDGRDVNDAIIHMLGYVAFDLKHRPTLEKYFRG